MDMHVWDFLPKFVEALKDQLENDEERWGSTWLSRTRKGQTERTMDTFQNYFDQYKHAGIPVNWLKIAGGALICWIRENNPDIWPE